MKKEVYLNTTPLTWKQYKWANRSFHIAKAIRDECHFAKGLYQLSGNVIFADTQAVVEFCSKANQRSGNTTHWHVPDVNAMALIDEINHYLVHLYREQCDDLLWRNIFAVLDLEYGMNKRQKLIELFAELFPPISVYTGQENLETYLYHADDEREHCYGEMEEVWMLFLANMNPAFLPYQELFTDEFLREESIYIPAIASLRHYLTHGQAFGPEGETLFDLLEKPAKLFPHSLQKQLAYMQRYWSKHFHLERVFDHRLVKSLYLLREQKMPKPGSEQMGNTYPRDIPIYTRNWDEPEAFTMDAVWMPNVVMIAKNVLVWLGQLSKKYGTVIEHLNQIPNEVLIRLAQSGINTLWLIGIWQRSYASKRIKQIMGNSEAVASAYSLEDNIIAEDLGGWQALIDLRERAHTFGIRLASDMVPNHTGMDSRWVAEYPDFFLQREHLPYDYHFSGENLTQREGLELYIDDGYYRKSDAAVVFKRVDTASGQVRYIYHGNDGTMMPWNDTAQIDFLNPQAREAVIQEIVNMAHNFPVIRLDAAMVLVKKHIQRLWYPSLEREDDCIPSRGEYAISDEEFDRLMPVEFWREVVDRIAKECPQTLLIAEAFWMLEGYFVRSLGMHRVYNSAFMHMLMQEDNKKYRELIKTTLTYDMGILKRFVNFMSNPDEKTAIEQFGNGDKYIGVATLMVTLPGLPMFAHGQLEGFREKYGMEYTRAYMDENEDEALWQRHQRDIFPLLHRRSLFSESSNFRLYDCIHEGQVRENVFAYSNKFHDDYALVLFNNSIYAVSGTIHTSVSYRDEKKAIQQERLGASLPLHESAEYYVIFQEQRSGLWYIRQSLDIHSSGLTIFLQGYESQVFWNFCEVYDASGHYKELHARLNGAGSRFDLLSTHPISFQLTEEIKEFSHYMVANNQEHYAQFQAYVGASQVEDFSVTEEGDDTNHPITTVVSEKEIYLRRIADICKNLEGVQAYVKASIWDDLADEYHLLINLHHFLTPKAKEFYHEDERYLPFAHYYFWLKNLHHVGVELDILASEVVKESLAVWWPKATSLEFALMHQLVLALIKYQHLPLGDRDDLDVWWQKMGVESYFMQSVGVNSYDDILYFHDESMLLSLDLILAALYLERTMDHHLYKESSSLNLLQQHKRWQRVREKSQFHYESFHKLILK